jgi:hypothetical protein
VSYAVVRFEVEGIRSLLMDNGMLATRIPGAYPPADLLRKMTANRSKTSEHLLAIAEVEFRGSLYHDQHNGVHVPADNLIRSLFDGATRLRRKADLKRALSSDPEHPVFPLRYDGPDTVAGLWGEGVGKSRFVLTVPARVGTAKIDRTRPIFPPPWGFRGFLVVDMSVVDLDTMQRIASLAGRLEGIGAWRAKYGRYAVTVGIAREL